MMRKRKETSMMKRLCLFVVLAVAVLLAASPAAKADHYFFAFLTGDQETPDTGSAAFGIQLLVLNNDLTELRWSLLYLGLEGGAVSGSHFHAPAPPGMGAGVVQGYTGFTSPNGYRTGMWAAPALSITRVEQLFDGLVYFNIHTPTWGGGEIRGQVWYVGSD
jgi:CHRD domain-containing protein